MLSNDLPPEPPDMYGPDAPDDDTPSGPWPFEVSQADLVGLGVVAAILLALTIWLGFLPVLVILGAAAGAFLAALVWPCIGGDVILDDLRLDALKCLAVGAYLVLGFWAGLLGLRALVGGVHGPEAPVFLTRGVVVFFLFTVGLFAKILWLDSDKFDALIITLGAIVGAVMAGALVSVLAGGKICLRGGG